MKMLLKMTAAVNTSPQLILGEDITTCDESVTLDAGEGYDSYLWSNGETTQSIEVSETGNYSVEVENGNANNSSLSFDYYDSNYIQLETIPLFPDMAESGDNNNFTISTWINPDSLGQDNIEHNFYLHATGGDFDNQLMVRNDSIVMNLFCAGFKYELNHPILEYNDWIHVAYTAGGVSNGCGGSPDICGLRLYINGEQVDSIDLNNDIDWTESFIYERIGGSGSYHGKIDNVQIWDIALTSNEITSYMCDLPYDTPHLMHFWDFEEGTGMTAFDQTVNGNDGTINGATWSNETPGQNCSFCSSFDEIGVTINVCGCMDETACNFDADAVEDDGSCEYITPVDLGAIDLTILDGTPNYSYLWSNGETTQSIEVSESGDYSVEVGNGNNSSLSFDGQNDYVQLGSSNLLPSNAITISTWFNSSGATLGTDDIFVSDLSWSTYTIRMGDQGNLGWRIQPNAGSPGDVTVIETFGNGVNYSDDNWHYISCTWDGSNMNMFIDGIQIPSNPIPTSFSSVGFTNDNATIGSYPTTNEEFFHGQLDNFEIWNTALSQSQIQNYMNCPPTGNEEGLVGYWNFDDGIGEDCIRSDWKWK